MMASSHMIALSLIEGGLDRKAIQDRLTYAVSHGKHQMSNQLEIELYFEIESGQISFDEKTSRVTVNHNQQNDGLPLQPQQVPIQHQQSQQTYSSSSSQQQQQQQQLFQQQQHQQLLQQRQQQQINMLKEQLYKKQQEFDFQTNTRVSGDDILDMMTLPQQQQQQQEYYNSSSLTNHQPETNTQEEEEEQEDDVLVDLGITQQPEPEQPRPSTSKSYNNNKRNIDDVEVEEEAEADVLASSVQQPPPKPKQSHQPKKAKSTRTKGKSITPYPTVPQNGGAKRKNPSQIISELRKSLRSYVQLAKQSLALAAKQQEKLMQMDQIVLGEELVRAEVMGYNEAANGPPTTTTSSSSPSRSSSTSTTTNKTMIKSSPCMDASQLEKTTKSTLVDGIDLPFRQIKHTAGSRLNQGKDVCAVLRSVMHGNSDSTASRLSESLLNENRKCMDGGVSVKTEVEEDMDTDSNKTNSPLHPSMKTQIKDEDSKSDLKPDLKPVVDSPSSIKNESESKMELSETSTGTTIEPTQTKIEPDNDGNDTDDDLLERGELQIDEGVSDSEPEKNEPESCVEDPQNEGRKSDQSESSSQVTQEYNQSEGLSDDEGGELRIDESQSESELKICESEDEMPQGS